MTTITAAPPADRVHALAWDDLDAQLDARGFAVTEPILDPAECTALADLFDSGRFRSTIDMARHRFGDGRYRYFDHPLPEPIAAARAAFYPHLAPVANRWSELLRGSPGAFPATHEELLERCRAAGQERPTPLILRYGEGDWNALHQDLYGDVFFPFQILTILSEPGKDFDGG
ncbi:MAG: 2OG-Fe(II) oxygenase, partial [Solirubrobacteraceae bacterium]